MLREIIRPTSENYNIHIPKEYINLHVDAPVSSTALRSDMNHTLIPPRVSDEIHQYYKENHGRQN